MLDNLCCPICGLKLRNLTLNQHTLIYLNKKGNYIERICNGINHCLIMYVEKQTKNVEFIKLSLNPKYSKFLEIDFINKKCRISCMKNSKEEFIDIPKMMEPDFPDLVKIKEKVAMYVTFS